MMWSFRKMSRGEINADPIEGEFFTPEGLADSLVRESIQNSLDARIPDETVQVRFHFSGKSNALSSDRGGQYLGNLWPHLRTIEGGRDNLPSENDAMPFLVIEDFGTRGLCGSTDQDTDADDSGGSEHRDFFYFWRNIGRSRKEDTQRGRWGLGKSVFPAASRMNSFFGYSVRSDDRRSFLMGKSVLKIHKIDNDRYCPYGFFADTAPDDFQRPFSDPKILERFRADFQLQRKRQPGLSIIIPFPDIEEIRPDQMIRSAVIHYFYPILRGDLIVQVSFDGREVQIDVESIDRTVDSVDWKDTAHTAIHLKNLFDMVRRTIPLKEPDLLFLPAPNPSRAPDWNVGRFGADAVAALKKQYAEKRLLAIRVPVTVRPKKGDGRPTFFDVFIEQDQEIGKAEDHYIRQGITISKISSLREKGFRGIVVVTDEPLSTLLGDSENPSHTEWLEKATKLKERYDWGPFTVRFVRTALQRIVAQLLHVPEGRNEQLLKNIFFLEDESDVGPDRSNRKAKKRSETEETPADPEPEILPTPSAGSAFVIQRIAGGFRVRRNSDGAPIPNEIGIETAYEVRRGNAFKKYEKWDFNLQKKPIVVTPVGAECTANGNLLTIKPTSADFLVEVVGFDPHRDLAVRTKPKKDEVGRC
jgi:hypothetical protein